MLQCPKCRSDRVHPSRSRSQWDRWRRRITGKRPYRCPQCAWRGWAPDCGPHFTADQIESSTRAIAPDPPNLKETALAPENRRMQEIDLAALDSAILLRKSRDRVQKT
jgi:hypothetical protein